MHEELQLRSVDNSFQRFTDGFRLVRLVSSWGIFVPLALRDVNHAGVVALQPQPQPAGLQLALLPVPVPVPQPVALPAENCLALCLELETVEEEGTAPPPPPAATLRWLLVGNGGRGGDLEVETPSSATSMSGSFAKVELLERPGSPTSSVSSSGHWKYRANKFPGRWELVE